MNILVLLKETRTRLEILQSGVDNITQCLGILSSQVSAIQQRLDEQEARREQKIGSKKQGGTRFTPDKRY